MKNPTVKDLIEVLSKMNPDAVVCTMDFYDFDVEYASVEVCREFNGKYINHNAEEVSGDIVAIG